MTVLTAVTAGVGLRINPTPWNSPGDPPIFDLVIYPATLALAASAPLWWFLSQGRFPSPGLFVVTRITTVVASTFLGACLLGIAERHSPRWKGVRDAFRQDIAGAKHPVRAYLEGHGAVEVEAPLGSPPQMRVDFGGGGVAVFDPVTMVCVYAD